MTLQTSQPLRREGLNASNRRVSDLVRMIRDDMLILDPPYQRGAVWALAQRRGLIESWLRGLPIPAVIINDRHTTKWADTNGGYGEVYATVDGRQRIETARMWIDGEFTVPASWFPAGHVAEAEGANDGPYVRYPGLTAVGRRIFDGHALLPVAEATLTTVQEEARVYLLINSQGTQQTDEDMARAKRAADDKT